MCVCVCVCVFVCVCVVCVCCVCVLCVCVFELTLEQNLSSVMWQASLMAVIGSSWNDGCRTMLQGR